MTGTPILISYLVHPLKTLRGVGRYLQTFGANGLYYALYCALSSNKKLVKVATSWSKTPLYVRLNSSDVLVFRQVFLEKEYEVITKLSSEIETIIDAGANIGLTSVFFSQLYPNARIVAIEPEAGNFELLQKNTKQIPNIECLCAALWNEDTNLQLDEKEKSEWAFRVTASTVNRSRTIPAYCISSLLNQFNVERASLLKMDIEGAEYEVLSNAEEWIARVDSIIVEVHETIRPGTRELLKQKTADYSLLATTRELTLLSKDMSGFSAMNNK